MLIVPASLGAGLLVLWKTNHAKSLRLFQKHSMLGVQTNRCQISPDRAIRVGRPSGLFVYPRLIDL